MTTNWLFINTFVKQANGSYSSLGGLLGTDYQISKQVTIETGYDVSPLDLTTAAGVVIDTDDSGVKPVFKDYTFAGIFPGMTQSTFNELVSD